MTVRKVVSVWAPANGGKHGWSNSGQEHFKEAADGQSVCLSRPEEEGTRSVNFPAEAIRQYYITNRTLSAVPTLPNEPLLSSLDRRVRNYLRIFLHFANNFADQQVYRAPVVILVYNNQFKEENTRGKCSTEEKTRGLPNATPSAPA